MMMMASVQAMSVMSRLMSAVKVMHYSPFAHASLARRVCPPIGSTQECWHASSHCRWAKVWDSVQPNYWPTMIAQSNRPNRAWPARTTWFENYSMRANNVPRECRFQPRRTSCPAVDCVAHRLAQTVLLFQSTYFVESLPAFVHPYDPSWLRIARPPLIPSRSARLHLLRRRLFESIFVHPMRSPAHRSAERIRSIPVGHERLARIRTADGEKWRRRRRRQRRRRRRRRVRES